MKRLIGMAALLAATTLAHAQGSNNAIPGAPASAAKKELVQRLLAIQQPALEGIMRDQLERPARQMAADAEQVLASPQFPADKRQEAIKKIQDLLNKYHEETSPLLKERPAKIGQSTLAPLYEEKYTEDELKQLVAMLESPVYKKFQQVQPELGAAYTQGLLKELEPVVQPKVSALQQGMGAALGLSGQTAAPAPKPAAKPAAPAASRPAKK